MRRALTTGWIALALALAAMLVSCGTSPAGDDDDDDDPGVVCGDDVCAGGESAATCPADCDDVCGDQTCGDSENAGTCSVDCPAMCGDDVCSNTESVMTCPADCPAVCGDSACTHQETAVNCSTDCPAVCGDDACTGGEGVATCPADCPPVCGDTMCSFGESAEGCPSDCAASCGDSACTHDESAESCPTDCPAVCNDGFCSTGETCSTCAQDCGACLPATIDITLVGALIRPAMADGRTWDGPDLSSEQIADMADLTALLAGVPPLYGDVAAFVTNLAIDAWSPPDPFGVGEIAWNGPFDDALTHPVATIENNFEDTVTPQWPGPPYPGWLNVPVSPTLRVRLTLQDEDLVNDDLIGTVELNEADLRAAYNLGGVAGIPVYDQGSTQILYVTLSVSESAPPPVCGGDCASGAYTACTCGAADPCGWLGDGLCDSYCTATFPADHFDDFTDCAAACATDCTNLTYSACSCASVDPCNWQGDGVCDSYCAENFPADHFNDGADCP